MRKRADDLLRDMRNRIENYNSWGDEVKTQNENECDAVYNKEKNETVDVSEDEDDCKKCLQNN